MTTLKSKFAKASLGLIAGASILLVAGSAFAADTFTRNLTVGSRGADVTALQTAVGVSPTTGYFGNMTKAAVKAYQTAKGISPVSGYVGPLTRGYLNAGGTTPVTPGTTPTTTGPVSVALASDNPVAGTVISGSTVGQATADLMHIAFNGSGTVTSVTLQRTGLSLNTDLSAVYLYQGATRITDAASVNSTGKIVFNGMNLAVNGMTNISVRADIAAGSTSNNIGVSMVGFTANGTANTVNIAGNQFYISTSSSLLGTANVTMANTATSTATVNAGTSNYTIWTAPVAVSASTSNAFVLKGASFHFVGSAPTNSLANLGLFVDGVKVASSTGVNAYSYVVFDLMSAPYALTNGSHTFDVRGDIVNGAARTAQLTLQNAGDLVLTNNTIGGVNVAPTAAGSNQTAFPLSGNTISISTGSVSITVDPSFNAVTNITGGATNAVIARYKINAYGEDEKITSVTLTPTIGGSASPATTTVANVQLYLNGSQIGSVCQYDGTHACTYTLGSSAIVPGGVTSSILEVHADIQNTSGTNYTAGTISVASATLNAQGMYSYNTLSSQTIPTTTAITISAGQMVVAKNGAYTNQTIAPNTSNTKIGSFTIQNQSSTEAIRLTNFAVALTTDGTTALTSTQFANYTNVKTSETTGSGATPQNGAASLNYSVDTTIAAGATKTVDIFGDIGSNTVGVETTLLVTAYGASTNVSLTGSAVAGQLISVATGSVSAPTFVASASTAPQYIATASSATDASKAEFKFTASNGSGTIQNLKFAVINSSTTSNTISSIRVGTQVASVVTPAAISGGLATTISTAATTVYVGSTANVPAGSLLKVDSEYMLVTAVPTSTTFTVTRNVIGSTGTGHATSATVTPSGLAYLTGVNVNVPSGTSGAYVDAFASYSPANGTTGAVASGTTSNVYLTYVKSQIGSTVSDTAVTPAPVSTSTNLMTVVGSKPTLTVNTVQQTGLVLSAENKIGEVTITTDAGGSIGINTLTFTVGGAGFATGPLIATGARLADGSTTISTATCATTSTATATSVVTCTFSDTNGYLVTGGASGAKTFSLYGTPSGTITSGATVSVSTALTTAGFVWTDVAGNGTASAESGSKIYNFPTGSYSIRQ